MPVDLEKLRAWVEKDKRSQSEIAAAAGMKQPHLSRFLSGAHADIPVSKLDRLAAAFGRKSKDLLK